MSDPMRYEDHEALQVAASGETITNLQSAEMMGGAFFQFEDRIAKDASGRLINQHPKQSETFTVKHEAVRLKVDKVWNLLQAGDTCMIAVGVSQSFKPAGTIDLTMEVTFTPALDTEPFVHLLASTSSEGKASLLQIAVLNQTLHSRFYLGGVPSSLHDVLFSLLARPARWLGYTVCSF